MKKLNIVIIGQWIYPMLNPRAHRTWQLAINFAKKGHNVTVYALLGDTDYSDFEKKYNIKVKNLGKSRLGCVNSDGKETNILQRLLAKMFRRNYQFPDIELTSLVKKVIDSLDFNVDILMTIASPHTIHWGAAMALPKTNVKRWVADCGDPFMLNPFNIPPSKFEHKEREWCAKVDAILVPIEDAKHAYYEEYRHKIHIVPQGFDFSNIKLADYIPNAIPTFAFSGLVYPKIRDPKRFLNYLLSIDINFKFIVYTKFRKHFQPAASLLGDKIEFRDFVPRDKLIYELSKMDFLINIENIGSVQQPSKLIDYAQTNRPILSISTEFTEREKESFNQFLLGEYQKQLIVSNVEQYDINNICRQILCLTK